MRFSVAIVLTLIQSIFLRASLNFITCGSSIFSFLVYGEVLKSERFLLGL